jgi:transposase-like protein
MMGMMIEDQPVRRRRSFSPEFKRDAVAMVLDEGRTIASVARALNVGETSLGKWVGQARVDRGEREGLTSSEREELAVLRKENAQLRMERDLLKRATAFWVKESGQ